MTQIPDDPIIRCMERTGYPPWYRRDFSETEERAEDDARGKEDDGSI